MPVRPVQVRHLRGMDLELITGMDSGAISTWLAVIATVMILQLAGTIVAIVVVARHAARASQVLESLAADARPILSRTAAVLDDVQDLAARARRAEAAAHEVATRVTTTISNARAVVTSRIWPVLGAIRGLQAMTRALRRRADRVDRDAERRFVYEGGSHAVE